VKIPVIDQGTCNLCGGCLDVCPDVFILNDELGIIEIKDMLVYPEDTIDETIAICPEDSISWEDE